MSAVGIGAAVAGASVASAGVNVLFAPYTAANNFIGSFFFGYGMILGERLMYQQDWPRIQERLAKGEQLFNIQNDYTREALNMITKQALEIKMAVNDEFLVPILQELLKMFGVDKIADVLTTPRGETDPRVGRGSPVPRPTTVEPPRTTTFVPPTNVVQRPGQVFSRTISQAQAPQGGPVVSRVSPTARGKQAAGQSQKLEQRKLVIQINQHVQQIRIARQQGKIRNALRWEGELKTFRQQLFTLESRYRF